KVAMTRFLIAGLVCFAACRHEVMNVGSQDGPCLATNLPCVSDSDCHGNATIAASCDLAFGMCVHCAVTDGPDAGSPPPTDGPRGDGPRSDGPPPSDAAPT